MRKIIMVECKLTGINFIEKNHVMVFSENTYSLLNDGRKAMEAFVKVAGLKIELPLIQ